MTPEQIELIRSSLARVQKMEKEFACSFYNRLFKIAPDVKPLFKGDLIEQGQKLMKMLGVIAANLDKPDTLMPAARELAVRHVGYGVKSEQYEKVGEALLWSFGQALDSAFTKEHFEAWATAYGTLSTEMIKAAYAPARI